MKSGRPDPALEDIKIFGHTNRIDGWIVKDALVRIHDFINYYIVCLVCSNYNVRTVHHRRT